MSSFLIIREEILCLVILLFIVYNSRMYKMGKDQGNFMRICFFAIGHVVFDIITVLTVNHLDVVPPTVNWICHIIFYMFALLYTYEFFCYIIALCYCKEIVRRVRRIGMVPLFIFLLISPFLPMEYLAGNGTNYSFGIAAFVGYGVAMLFFVSSFIVVLNYRHKLDKHIVRALLPMLTVSVALEILQIAIPEMLFTGAAVTIVTLGFFFSLENPIAVLRQKVFVDALTGVKSRLSYEADINRMDRKFVNGLHFGMVFCDINGLKAVNDSQGHLEGDIYIGLVAETLMTNLVGAEAIYRMGGDEFLAVYQGRSAEQIQREIEAVHKCCEELSQHQDYEVSVAIGYAISSREYKSLRDVLRTADYQMYTNKARLKKQRTYLLTGKETLNVACLTDRIFDALALAEDNRFLFATNLSTNVTRWSHSAIEYFGFPGEFVFECSSWLLGRVHPEDRDAFANETETIMASRQAQHNMEFRLKNASENYVVCDISGTILKGKNGEPDLFAGMMTVQNVDESIDRITDLRNGYEMMNYFNYLIHSHTPAAMLNISILNLNSINILYGYACGDDILKQFAFVLRNIVGSDGSIFRSDGTKFVICAPHKGKEEIIDIYQRICRGVEQRIHINSLTPPLQLAAGAHILNEDFDGNSSILRSNLIFAYTQSKYSQRGRLFFYDTTMLSAYDNSDRNKLMLSIHQDAITGCRGFFMTYQPIVCAATGRIIGAEALLRWSDPDLGVVSPDRFIPWLEGDPCFFQLGNWILREALLGAKKILELQPEFVLNINIAMPQLEHEQFRESVLSILKETHFPPQQLCLELTERCRELDLGYLKEEIEFFRGHGIRIALDDLGTGFSSFGLLLSLNVDEIKLDHTFIKEVQTKRVNQILIRMMVEAAVSMGYASCLEGVEDDALCRYLDSFGATYYQGYYCAKPLSLDQFIEHLQAWNSTHGEIE